MNECAGNFRRAYIRSIYVKESFIYNSLGRDFLALVAVQAYSAFALSNEIVGSWKNGSDGMSQYQNRTTGATKPGRGSIFTYKFNPNGAYEFVGYSVIWK